MPPPAREGAAREGEVPPAGSSRFPRTIPWANLLLLAVLLAHGAASLASLGGPSDLASPWPIPTDDHPMHLHNAWVARSFLRQNGTTAGYDPFFMAGYANSIVSDASGTMIESIVALTGGEKPIVAYKRLVLLILVSLPLWLSMAARAWGGSAEASATAVCLYLVYLWIDFPLNYAGFGMVAFLMVVPAGLLVSAWIVGYLNRGGFGRWLLAAGSSAALLWVHPLSLMFVGPMAGLAYLLSALVRSTDGTRLPLSRHLGLWTLVLVSLTANAWWWAPALLLAPTGMSQHIAFVHDPGETLPRLAQIVGLASPVQPEIQIILLATSVIGLTALYGIGRLRRFSLGVLLVVGFFWGYLSGLFPALKPLQPGRHTYTLYTTAALVAGLGWGRLATWLRDLGRPRLTFAITLGAILVGLRLFGAPLNGAIGYRTGYLLSPTAIRGKPSLIRPSGMPPFLSSRPDPRLLELVEQVKKSFSPGDRIYYEEGGQSRSAGEGKAELNDPFGGRRFGGLLPLLTGVEVIGGPFLNVPVKTNFTQVGMGRLFGKDGWDRERFDRYARLYRPHGLVVWSPDARAFVETNPDRVEVEAEIGPFLVARVKGYEGRAIRGKALVQARPGQLVVQMEEGDEVDGKVVLSYHTTPGIRATPPIELEQELLEEDPVPFLRLPYAKEPVTLEIWPFPR